MAADRLTGTLRRPFPEQIRALRGRLGNLVPTATWRDLMREQHDRAFMVAGAAKADLLADLAAAVERAIVDGESLSQFRARFADIVARNGWTGYTGSGTPAGIAWRTRVIYRTNAATSYAAGRLAQLQEFPIWVYRHGGSQDPRPQHLAWDGLTLPANHPFWQTHSPPNGWGCSCYVVGASTEAGARRVGGNPQSELPEGWDRRASNGRLPGIDAGWDYQPGASVVDEIASSVAGKTVSWPHELARAYMESVPVGIRDALATAQRAQPETGQVLRRYAERVLGVRNGSAVGPVLVQPVQTVALLTEREGTQVRQLLGLSRDADDLWEWALNTTSVDGAAPADLIRLPRLLSDGVLSDAGQADGGARLIRVSGAIGEAVFEADPPRRMLLLRAFRSGPR
jgi:hypothetical protein